ncbi:beta-lactamase [Dyella sp. M7H15-1]|uniref:class C beta-lactamase n=1 Tax=Dyella sp. M7H15-1 TaxID=2501295 RepID=UPI0010051A08|nr:class C beta-lactamase [Dyella sp. M7H15-1]QAU24583.1 beta-lactamase [Dyella sp. M7H15-1]
MGKFHAACLLAATAIANAALAATPQKDIDTNIQPAVQAFMQQYKVPGVAIALTVDGKQHFYNYGVASRDTQQQVTSDTLFEIGSISKTFTATLVAYALVNGQLSLTDHPGKYLPELKGSDFDKVTLLNLGTHTAGGFPIQVPDEIQNTSQLMAYFKAWKPQYPAGTQRTYANPSVGMLGLIAAKSMQTPFDVAIEHVLLPKLGMSDTYLHVPADKMVLYAQGYNNKDAPVRVNPGMLWEEAYGVKTNARDLLRFVEINLGLVNVEPKLKQAIEDTHVGYFRLGAMTQDLIWEQLAYPVSLNDLLEGSSDHVVLQNNVVTPWQPSRAPQQDVLINKTGSTAGFGAYVAFIPSKKMGIVLLTNRSNPTDARLRLAYTILNAANALSN